ncbi:MAG: SAM-dependent methyltransferase [Terriglobales bacterium]|nr:SAM-dependent methyltransferase [Terriglobales bacterium]
MQSVSQTARWVAAQRERESARSDRLFLDTLAGHLAGEEGRAALRISEQFNPRHKSTADYIATRTRFLDEFVIQGNKKGTRQVVIVAAGMDARAYRLPWQDGTALYEIDYPELLDLKERILKQQDKVSQCHRITLGTNLEGEWGDMLVGAGFQTDQASLWLIEGLLYYLHEAPVDGILRQVTKLAAPGSQLAADLVSQSCLTSPWMKEALEAMKKNGMGWYFGSDDPSSLFARHGWEAEIKNPNVEAAKYDPERFPMPANPQVQLPPMFFVIASR